MPSVCISSRRLRDLQAVLQLRRPSPRLLQLEFGDEPVLVQLLVGFEVQRGLLVAGLDAATSASWLRSALWSSCFRFSKAACAD